MSSPSIGRSGSGAPTRRAIVGRTSIVMAGSRTTVPGGMRPGQRATNGTRTPPSNAVPLPSRSGPAEPAWSPYESQGPLSEAKITSVSRSRPRRRSAASTWPTESSISSTTSP